MGQIQIEVFEYALLINHDEGLTVVFPEYDHTLMIQEHNGKLTPVARGANLEVCGPGGAPLDPAQRHAAAARPRRHPGGLWSRRGSARPGEAERDGRLSDLRRGSGGRGRHRDE